MRVLFTTTGHSGHLLPLAPLARECRHAGHDILVATYSARSDAVERLGFPVHAIDEAPDQAWAPVLQRVSQLPQAQGDALIIADGFARTGGGAALPHLLSLVESWKPGVLVHECYEFAGPIAAEVHGVPLARVALGLSRTEDWVNELAAPAVADMRREAGLAPAGASPALLSLVASGLDDGPATQRFRDALPPEPPPLPDWWNGSDDPLVYFTFGSVTGSLPFFPALYDSVLEALAPLPARVLLTLGRDADPAKLGPLPDNTHLEDWVAQDEVLPHAAVVVSHGGYGTTLGALSHGAPLVLLPMFAGDQWRTARRVAELRAGVLLEDGERRVFDPPEPHVIAALPGAVKRVLEEPRFRRAAESIAREQAELPPAEAAVGALEALTT
jgi:UDP:flavonoid glycosyltransferase YjiC (YdhE family)